MQGVQGQPPNYMAYDRTIVVFSPDGRLLQVEYARQMVKNGSTSVGIKINDGVLLGTVRIQTPLAVAESYKKIYEIDNHIALVSSGSIADARDLVSIGRVKSQVNKVTYGEPISVSSLTTYLCDRKHMVTQYAGIRPYGVGLLVGGVEDSTPKLYETEPSGTMIEWKAQAIGRGADKAKKVLISEYKDNLDLKTGAKLLLKAIKTAEKSVDNENIEMVVVKNTGIKKIDINDLSKK
ncbi:MAG: archaeal proteasome endopeptidase complex subunit alpha [Nanoarchaeota archaeon]